MSYDFCYVVVLSAPLCQFSPVLLCQFSSVLLCHFSSVLLYQIAYSRIYFPPSTRYAVEYTVARATVIMV